MADVVDVASRVLELTGYVTTMKLQKLVYYCQAYHAATNQRPLFNDRIEAWPHGPVSPRLFAHHRRMFMIRVDDLAERRSHRHLSAEEDASIRHVVNVLGRYTGEQLIELTHSEDPWRNARAGLGPGERSHNEISVPSMRRYYTSPACNNPVFA